MIPARPHRTNRLFVEAVLWIARTGAPWRDLPHAFSKWYSIYTRFWRWAQNGVWERIFKALPDDPDFVLPLGPADVKREGTDITVFAYGLMLHHSLRAADELAKEGVSANVVDVRSLRPLDAATIVREARKTGKCLVVYEDNRMFGAGAEIAALIAEEAFDGLDAPVMRLGGPEVPAMPYNKPQEDWFMPDPQKIATKMRELAAY